MAAAATGLATVCSRVRRGPCSDRYMRRAAGRCELPYDVQSTEHIPKPFKTSWELLEQRLSTALAVGWYPKHDGPGQETWP